MNTDQNDALVVVPCLNEENGIAGVLQSLTGDRAAGNFLIVVADGGSSDRTREIVSKIASENDNVRLMDNPLKIQSAGVNRAVKLFGRQKRYLVRLDAHADYPQDFVSDLIGEAQRTGATSVVVAMDSQGRSCFQKAAAIAQNTFLGAGGSAHRTGGKEGFVDHGHHALFDMRTFRALNGYDEQQSHNEDAELDVRIARAGGRIWLTRATNLVYYPRDRLGKLFVQYRNFGYGRATTLMRHKTRPKIRQIAPAAVAPAVAGLAATPWFHLAIFPVLVWLGFCLAYGCALGLRRRERCAFASGAAALTMHLGWSLGFWRGLWHAALRSPASVSIGASAILLSESAYK